MAVTKKKRKRTHKYVKREPAWVEREAQPRTVKVRALLLKEAERAGVLSNERACKVGRLQQAWYHLYAMVKDGQLKRAGYNQWMPVRR